MLHPIHGISGCPEYWGKNESTGLKVCSWLHSDIPWGTPERLLLPQKPTFEGQCPLIDEFRLLHHQEQTFLAVPPFVWF